VKKKATVVTNKKQIEPEDAEKKAYQNFMMETQNERPNAASETSRVVTIDGERLSNGLIKRTVQPGENQKHYLKRTKYMATEDGLESEYIDIITNPVDVKQILDRRRRQRSGSKAHNFLYSEAEESKRQANKKIKRKIQEKLRRQKKIQKMKLELQERYKQGSRDGTLPGLNVTLQCGRCGMYGHMKTNKSCPVYVGDEEEEAKSDPSALSEPSIVLRSRADRLTVNLKREKDTPKKRKYDDMDSY
jgi:hypothetical protein